MTPKQITRDDFMRALGAEQEWWCAAPDFLACWPRPGGGLIVQADLERTDEYAGQLHPYPDRHKLCHWQWTLPVEVTP